MSKQSEEYVFLGFPDDRGIQNVGGRVGAAEGPSAFQTAFQRMTGAPKIPVSFEMLNMSDDLEKDYLKAIESCRKLIQSHRQLLAVGGGHDYAYPVQKAFAEVYGIENVGVLNLDAHFDLRPYDQQMTSGSPFRRLIQEGSLLSKGYVPVGIQLHANSEALFQYAKNQKIKIVMRDEVVQFGSSKKRVEQLKSALKNLLKKFPVVWISFDLDVMSYAHAPGVSAPQLLGLDPDDLKSFLEFAGSHPRVKGLGIYELSPPWDSSQVTARGAAQLAWYYLNQVRQRKINE